MLLRLNQAEHGSVRTWRCMGSNTVLWIDLMAELEHSFILEQPIHPGSHIHAIVDDRHPDGIIGWVSRSSGVSWFYDRNMNQVGV